MNSINLIGRLTDEARMTETHETTIANFFVAVPRIGSEEADFVRVVAFGKTAEFVDNYFHKGDRIGISGRIQTGRYENKDGVTVYTTDVIAERVDFADGRKDDRKEKEDKASDRSNRSKRYSRK